MAAIGLIGIVHYTYIHTKTAHFNTYNTYNAIKKT